MPDAPCDALILDAVLAHPGCPVAAAGADFFAPDQPIPWPRRRVAIPIASCDSYARRCHCRRARPLGDWPWTGQVPAPGRPAPPVVLTRLEWAAPPAEVYVGQCGDCGTIFWALARR